MGRRRGLGWPLSVGSGGTCGLYSRGESLVLDETRKRGEGGGRRGGNGGHRERGHLAFPHEGDGRQEGRQLIEWEQGLPGNEMLVPVEQEEE